MENTQNVLERAATGLMMMSESDYPFDYVSTEANTINEDLVLQLAGKPVGSTMEKITIDHLLRNMTDPASGSVSPATAQQFRQLANTLKQQLKDLTVYRVGDVQVDVFILGITQAGMVAGMRTKLIET